MDTSNCVTTMEDLMKRRKHDIEQMNKQDMWHLKCNLDENQALKEACTLDLSQHNPHSQLILHQRMNHSREDIDIEPQHVLDMTSNRDAIALMQSNDNKQNLSQVWNSVQSYAQQSQQWESLKKMDMRSLIENENLKSSHSSCMDIINDRLSNGNLKLTHAKNTVSESIPLHINNNSNQVLEMSKLVDRSDIMKQTNISLSDQGNGVLSVNNPVSSTGWPIWPQSHLHYQQSFSLLPASQSPIYHPQQASHVQLPPQQQHQQQTIKISQPLNTSTSNNLSISQSLNLNQIDPFKMAPQGCVYQTSTVYQQPLSYYPPQTQSYQVQMQQQQQQPMHQQHHQHHDHNQQSQIVSQLQQTSNINIHNNLSLLNHQSPNLMNNTPIKMEPFQPKEKIASNAKKRKLKKEKLNESNPKSNSNGTNTNSLLSNNEENCENSVCVEEVNFRLEKIMDDILRNSSWNGRKQKQYESSKVIFKCVMSSLEKSTKSLYATYLERWKDFCDTSKVDVTPHTRNLLKFLETLQSEGLSYSTISIAKAAILLAAKLQGICKLDGDHVLKSYMKSVKKNSPNQLISSSGTEKSSISKASSKKYKKSACNSVISHNPSQTEQIESNNPDDFSNLNQLTADEFNMHLNSLNCNNIITPTI